MSTDLTLQIKSTSSETTEQLGATLGKNLRGGEVIVLSSDLGGGKTTLTRGIAKGAGSDDAVGSPTFTISRVYSSSNFEIHHFDFYRLSEPGIVTHELAEVMQEPNVVVVIEWADIVKDVLPRNYMQISITQTGDDTRDITIQAPQDFDYLLQGLSK